MKQISLIEASTVQSRISLPPLTSLRFFAALSIVFYHVSGRWGLPAGIFNGSGVELFFILSGFILAYNYRSIPSFKEGLRVIAYRIARIWPLHLLTLAAAFAVRDNSMVYADLERLWAVIPLIQTWLGNGVYALSGNAVSWTISVELAFYLAFPVLTVLASRNVVAATVAVTVLAFLWAYNHRGVPFQSDNTSAIAIFMTHPAAFMMQFAAGMLACRLFLSRQWILSFGAATVFEIFAVVLLLVFYINVGDISLSLQPHLRPPASVWLLEHFAAIVFMLPLIFVLAIGRGALSRILAMPALVYLGEISFATYMCHALVLAVVLAAGLTTKESWLAYFAVTYGLSVGLYHLVERPAQRFIRRHVDKFLARERVFETRR